MQTIKHKKGNFDLLCHNADSGQCIQAASLAKRVMCDIIILMEGGVSQFKTWYFSKPLVTRTYLAICAAMTLLITLQVLSPQLLYYSFRLAFMELNLWRPFTALFFMGKFSFGTIFNMYFAFIAISKVETLVFTREKYADFLWLNVLLFLGCLIVGSLISIHFFSEPYQMAMIYIWCKRFPHEQITLMFGFIVKTGYFPFVYAIMMTLFGAGLLPNIVGIVLGHCYIFVKDIAVVRYHKDYFQTPMWFNRWWYGAGQQPARRVQGGFFQGQGVRLA